MKKKNYKNKRIDELTAEEASHMLSWVLVKSFFTICLISVLIYVYVSFCTYLALRGKFDDFVDFNNWNKIEYETNGDLHELPVIDFPVLSGESMEG